MNEIDNEYIIDSLKNNYEDNEIFKLQKHDTIHALENKINEMPKQEILFELDFNQIVPFHKLRSNFKDDDIEDDKFWNHVVALLFMNILYENYFIETKHNLDEEKKLLTRATLDDYKRAEPILANRNDVIETIKEIGFPSPRVHIVMNYINNENVKREVTNYLSESLPFSIKLYSDCDIQTDNLNNVKVYDKNGEGIVVKQETGKSYEKKI